MSNEKKEIKKSPHRLIVLVIVLVGLIALVIFVITMRDRNDRVVIDSGALNNPVTFQGEDIGQGLVKDESGEKAFTCGISYFANIEPQVWEKPDYIDESIIEKDGITYREVWIPYSGSSRIDIIDGFDSEVASRIEERLSNDYISAEEIYLSKDSEMILESIFNDEGLDAQRMLDTYLGENIGREIEEKDLACIREELERFNFEDLMGHYVGIMPYFNDTFTEIIGMTDKYVSVIQGGMIYFGGAYPDKTTDYVTFERDSGEEVNINDVFNAGIVDEITQRAYEIYAQGMPECEESLSYRDLADEFNNGYGISYGFVQEGVQFIIYFPNVAKPCEESIFISYEDIQEYLK